jgi:hypothetical protein
MLIRQLFLLLNISVYSNRMNFQDTLGPSETSSTSTFFQVRGSTREVPGDYKVWTSFVLPLAETVAEKLS